MLQNTPFVLIELAAKYNVEKMKISSMKSANFSVESHLMNNDHNLSHGETVILEDCGSKQIKIVQANPLVL